MKLFKIKRVMFVATLIAHSVNKLFVFFIAAAHCFYYGNGQIEARYFKIAVGKFYRSFYNTEDDSKHWVQKRDV